MTWSLMELDCAREGIFASPSTSSTRSVRWAYETIKICFFSWVIYLGPSTALGCACPGEHEENRLPAGYVVVCYDCTLGQAVIE